MKTLKNTLLSKFVLVLLIALSFHSKVHADHLGAMDIYVDWVGAFHGDYKYKVTLIIYRSCAPNNLHFSTDSQSVQISSASCGVANISLKVDTVGNDSMQIVDQLCPNFHSINSCYNQFSPWPGFEKWTYTGYVTLPSQCRDWRFSFISCCRNLNVVNLVAGGIYVSTVINNLDNDTVSSPRFYVDPIPYICVNQPASFFNGPVDPDGDSIITVTQTPLMGLGSPNTYQPGFSINSPVVSTTPYLVNAFSGVATFTPAAIGQYILAFTCNKYDPKTHVFLGSTERDVQVSILNCASPPPQIDTLPTNIVNGGTTFGNIVVTCPNSALSFDVGSKSQSATNAVFLTCDPGTITTSTFTIAGQGTATPKGTFAWTPTTSDFGPHVVVILATDSTCTAAQPIIFKAYIVITIDVLQGIVAFPKDYYSCGALNGAATLNVSNIHGFNYSWTDINGGTSTIVPPTNFSANPQVRPPFTTQYVVNVINPPPGCKSSDTVTVHVDTSTHIVITPPGPPGNPIILCQPGVVALSETPSGLQPFTNVSCGITDTSVNHLTQDHDSTVVAIQNATLVVTPGNLSSPFGSFNSTHHQYLFKSQDLRYSGMYSSALTGIGFIISNSPGALYDSVTISLKCTQSPLNTAGIFETGTSTVFSGPINIAGPGLVKIPFTAPFAYNWDSTMDLIVDVCVGNRVGRIPALSATNSFHTVYQSVIGSYLNSGNVCSGASPDSTKTGLDSLPQIELYYDHTPLAGYAINWIRSYGSVLLSDSTTPTTQLYVHESSKYLVSTFSRNGCHAYDSVYILLDNHSASISPTDTSICLGRFVPITVYGGSSLVWYQNGFDPTASLSCTDCFNPVAKPIDTTRYTAVVTDQYSCMDTLYMNVNILPLPVFTASPHDTIIKYGKSIQLNASNDSLNYVWSPISSLNDPYATSPIAKPSEPTVYVVIGFLNNCTATDTVRVGIDYRAPLIVPSAFTPNHDGKNDRLRIAGLTYQRVIEFRVFNRLGQQIFGATDNSGWDGTWNGVDQDIDTYFYLVRVAYPDGVIETFKGDVTLIR